ncbi:MAG TPA: class I SAM-dependent methyltransferase [Candidatus Methanofastidiosa archaeon]|nr:class I SAM-dependent methyltransferase [Candidatus Methanofastidiosa archaeon]HPR41357.1 class I SAM-dependent methyltransferase [Candidatus Methanofastidiosa archaeon]
MVKDDYEKGFVDKILGDIFYTTTQNIREEISNKVPVDSETKILVVACRTGETVFYFAKEFDCKVIGVDLFDENIKEAEKIARREKLTKKASFIKGHAMRLPLEDDSFDLVIFERSLSCYDDKSSEIEECVRVLARGGTFVMADFTVDQIEEDEREDLKELTCLVSALSMQGYLELLSKSDLRAYGEVKEDIAERNTRLLIQKWKKIRLFSNIFLKASSADAGRFETLMRKGEMIIKEKRLGYALFIGVKD